jgi:biopolymer transport protein ExbD
VNYQYRSQQRYLTAFNFSSLTDIVMLLLVFFLLTSSFIVTQGMNVTLPKSVEHQTPMRKTIAVSIGKDKRVFLNSEQVTKEQLSGQITALLRQDPDQQVIVRADKDLALQDVVETLDIVRGAGASRLFIATDSPGNQQR